MNKQEITRKLELYPRGIIVRLNWNRLNGNLERDYIYFGNNFFDGTPMLLDYEGFEKNHAIFFDLQNPEIVINDLAVTTNNSLERLINLR